MQAARRSEYLKALGIDVWVARTSSAKPHFRGIVMGPGTTGTLILCADAGEAASTVAADIARSLDCEPVWCWLADEESEPGVALDQAIANFMFTRVLVLGEGLLDSALPYRTGPEKTRVIGSASVLVADSVAELVQHGESRLALWRQLNGDKWCGPRGPQNGA